MSDKNASVLLPDEAGIARAAQVLRDGRLVAIPTETVYGLAARADSADAVASIYRLKGRPDFNPLIVHVSSVALARELAVFCDKADLLAESFWPGPLTLVLPLRAGAALTPAVTAGLPTVALRMPAHPVAHAVLQETGLPLAAPSANRSTGVSPTRVEHVLKSFGSEAPLVLDGGHSERGLESTIVALRANGCWNLLRPGPVTSDDLTPLLGAEEKLRGATIEAPGQLVKHYSPGKPVLLDVDEAPDDSFFVGFGPMRCDFNLSESGDLAEAASRLYQSLYEGAAATESSIAYAPIPETGMGRAINDRLVRASSR